MKNGYISSWQGAKVFAQIAEIENGREIHDALAGMALRKGLSQEDSETLAARIMSGVYSYESTREMLETSVEDAAAPLFERLSEKTPEEQAAALDQILFGFEAMGDDELFRQTIADSEKAYTDNRGDVRFGPGSVETLKAELLKKMGNMNLSPKAMDRMISRLKNSGDYTATAAALGRRGFALKSVAAMTAYLEAGEGADITEAVTGACASVDVQALGDAVNRGLIARKAARIILGAIVLAVTLMLLIACFSELSLAFSALSTVTDKVLLMSIGKEALVLVLLANGVMDFPMLMEPVTEKAADWAGRLTVLLSGLVRKGKEAVEDGLKAVIESVSIPDGDAEADDELELNWELNEEPDRAF